MVNNPKIEMTEKEKNDEFKSNGNDDDDDDDNTLHSKNGETVIEPMLSAENGKKTSYNNSDVRALIGRVLNSMGRFQYAILFAMAVNGIIFGVNQTLTSFHVYTPTFYCKENNDTANSCEGLPNGTCPSGFRFNDDDYTFVSEWSLVCERRLWAPMVNTLYFAGGTIASPFAGIFADKFGRKKVFFISMIVQCILGIALSYTQTIQIFIILRTIQGFFLQGIQGVTVTMMAEYFPPRFRTTAMITYSISFVSGLAVISGMSYFCRHWRWLQIVVAIPSLFVVCYSWAVPESIYWLYATNRKDEAVKLCIKTARLNGDKALSLEIKENVLVHLKNKNQEEIDDIKEQPEEKQKKATLLDIYRTVCLRYHLLIMIWSRFSISLAFFSSLFFLNKTTGNRHFNFFISAGIDVIGLFFVFISLSRFGRRYSLIFYQLATAVLFGTICVILVFVPDTVEIKGPAITVFSLLAKAAASSTFSVLNTFSTELFPTICRGSAYGVIGLCARLGNIGAPFLIVMGEYTSMFVPLGLLCVILILGSLFSVVLPETVNKVLPNTIDEAHDMWGKKSK